MQIQKVETGVLFVGSSATSIELQIYSAVVGGSGWKDNQGVAVSDDLTAQTTLNSL